MSSAGPAPDVGVIIAAAGRGDRAGPGELKQFREIAGVPMLLRAIRPLAQHPRVRELVVVLPRPHHASPPDWLDSVAGERLRLAEGGATRAVSVLAGLTTLDQACKIVLVHDAARPFVSRETVDAVIATAAKGIGAVPALAVSDTVKRATDTGGPVGETIDRTGLWRAQTPQGFPRAMLEHAYEAQGSALENFTDDAALVEAAGHPVHVVPDQSSNIKITTAADFALAEALASR